MSGNRNALVSGPLPSWRLEWTANILWRIKLYTESLFSEKFWLRTQLVGLLLTNCELSLCRRLYRSTFFLFRLCRIDGLSRGLGNTKRTDVLLICIWNSPRKYSFIPCGVEVCPKKNFVDFIHSSVQNCMKYRYVGHLRKLIGSLLIRINSLRQARSY